MDEENPAAFRLPSDITTFFAGVAEDARGNYVDHEEPRNKNEYVLHRGMGSKVREVIADRQSSNLAGRPRRPEID
jgi:hypothetical protein